jgi:hypothetical protein
MREYKILYWTIEQLCDWLKASHVNAEISEKEQKDLDKIRELSELEDRVVIKFFMHRFQEWFDIYLDNSVVANAYIDHEILVGKSWWHIQKNF